MVIVPLSDTDEESDSVGDTVIDDDAESTGDAVTDGEDDSDGEPLPLSDGELLRERLCEDSGDAVNETDASRVPEDDEVTDSDDDVSDV